MAEDDRLLEPMSDEDWAELRGDLLNPPQPGMVPREPCVLPLAWRLAAAEAEISRLEAALAADDITIRALKSRLAAADVERASLREELDYDPDDPAWGTKDKSRDQLRRIIRRQHKTAREAHRTIVLLRERLDAATPTATAREGDEG